MNYLAHVRKKLIESLWESYKNAVPQASIISNHLLEKFIKKLPLDHFAIIDLPSETSGIPYLKKIFEMLGFQERGGDYLPDKQNAFIWMTDLETMEGLIEDALPQVVLADFRFNELPLSIQLIIEKYVKQIKPAPLEEIEFLIQKARAGDFELAESLVTLLLEYFNKRDWCLPTINDYETVNQVNELLAWVLVFGHQPNHFTFQIHKISEFPSLTAFNQYVMETLNIPLNNSEGFIKGSHRVGLEQSSTLGEMIEIKLADGTVLIPNRFVEFIWRYPLKQKQNPQYWKDYFNDFIAMNANRVIESLYSSDVND